jgi:hypothetical protein
MNSTKQCQCLIVQETLLNGKHFDLAVAKKNKKTYGLFHIGDEWDAALLSILNFIKINSSSSSSG